MEMATEWVTIKTAPKDGTKVLTTFDFKHEVKMFWNQTTQRWHISADISMTPQPTHWMPQAHEKECMMNDQVKMGTVVWTEEPKPERSPENLVSRLRDADPYDQSECSYLTREAADRIEELEAEKGRLREIIEEQDSKIDGLRYDLKYGERD